MLISAETTLQQYLRLIFVVAPCVLIVLSPLFIQLMHTNYYKIVKQLKSFQIIIVAPTCFGLHKPSSGNSQPVLWLHAATVPITSNNVM